MAKMTPYLLFQGKCEEAMTFYHDCLGGELQLTKVGDSPMATMFPDEQHSRIINAVLTVDDMQLSASDWMKPDSEPVQGNTTCVFIAGAPYEQLKTYFAKLSIGASQEDMQALHAMPFGTYGQLTDKFGIRWMFQGDKKA